MLLPSTVLTKSGVSIEQAAVTDERIVVVVTATRIGVPCPLCGHLSHHIHSRYRRTIADLPAQGVAVRLDLHTRRFWCDEPTCPQPSCISPPVSRS